MKKNIISPSAQQINIIEQIKNHNLCIDCCAGSGKTTTCIFIAKIYSNKNILLLTYNSLLKLDVREKVKNITNITVHSFHSFCTNFYDKNAYTDFAINTLLANNTKPVDYSYDFIIIDEAQDMTPLFYKLVLKILDDNKVEKEKIRMVILGDKNQCIYKFKESDHRFITLANKLYPNIGSGMKNQELWKNAVLSETFRLTKQMCSFVNLCIGYKKLESNKSGDKVDYIICNSYGSFVKNKLKQIVNNGYLPGDIFVVSPSVKDNTPIKNLANFVTNTTDYPIYCSSSDMDNVDSKIIKGKIVFSTIHQVKGRERKVVIYIGFDEGYNQYYNKSENNLLSNELYVAITRAKEKLVIVHDNKRDFLPFINQEKLEKLEREKIINLIYETEFITKSKKKNVENLNFSVSELCSYLPFSVEYECRNFFDVVKLKDSEYQIRVNSIVSDKGHYESVSDIIGIAIPAYFEYLKCGKSTIIDRNIIETEIEIIKKNKKISEESKIHFITKLKKFSKTLQQFHKEHIKNISLDNLSIENLLKISLYYSCSVSKLDFKLKQVNTFDFLEKSTLDVAIDEMKKVILSDKLIFEEPVSCDFDDYYVMGEMDCIDETNNIVYEFKCTKDITINHMIQMAIYLYLNYSKKYKHYIFNIFTGEIIEIKSSEERLKQMIKILIENKIKDCVDYHDEEFIEKNIKL